MEEYDVFRVIANDEFLQQFLDKERAPNVVLSVAEQIKKLSEVITLMDKELQKQVLSNHDGLLSQATWVEKLEQVLAVMQTHVQSLLSAVERLRTKIVEPFSKIETQTVMLSRLHATSDLLRRVARIQHLVKRLNSQMKLADINKAAQCLSELAQLSENVDLSGLEVLEEDQRSIRSHRVELERQARTMLTQGLKAQNQSQVGMAVQVFHHLGSLHQSVEQVVQSAEHNIADSIKEALDAHILTQTTSPDVRSRGGPGRSTMLSPGNTTMFRTRLWSALERIFDTVYIGCSQVELLQRVLNRKLTISQQAEKQQLVDKFWQSVTSLLARQLSHEAHNSLFVKQALEGEYPKFLRLYLDLCKRLQALSNQSNGQLEVKMIISTDSTTAETSVFQINREVVVEFENAYLSRSVSRLLDPVHLMFSGETVPSHEEVDSLIRTITSELSVSLVDVSLSRTVARNISKTVRLFCLKCEQMIVTSGEATQVIDSPTPGQILNVSIGNLLHYLNCQVVRVISNMKTSLQQDTSSIVMESLSNTELLTTSIVSTLLASISDGIEAIILTMHNEDYSMISTSGDMSANLDPKRIDVSCSLYMKELQSFVSRAVSSYLAPFHNQEIISKCCAPVVSRCLELFVRHTGLVRPLGEGGRIKLAADYAQMELAVSPLYKQLSDLGRPYRVLRSFRPLLFQTVEDISVCPALGDVIPYSLVLLSLFARGPTELPSPHQSANWSVSRFSQWLDMHTSEHERLELMSGALQKYQQTVRHKGETSFHAVYPVMINLLERGVKHIAAPS